MDLHDFPTLNASLNGLSVLLLLAGRFAISKGNREKHKNIMLAAMATSAAFLGCYLYRYYFVEIVWLI